MLSRNALKIDLGYEIKDLWTWALQQLGKRTRKAVVGLYSRENGPDLRAE